LSGLFLIAERDFQKLGRQSPKSSALLIKRLTVAAQAASDGQLIPIAVAMEMLANVTRLRKR
jgi:hypothetical protein